MGDVFGGGVCFDNRKEGDEGECRLGAPLLQGPAQASLAASDRGGAEGKAKGRSKTEWKHSDPMREAGEPSTGQEC
jgi:hypothetical protein